MGSLSAHDTTMLRQAIEESRRSRESGNHPFGASFVDSSGAVLLTGHNSVVTTGDLIDHAETNLAREMGLRLSAQQISTGTLYSSCEPCAMCAGAMYWVGVNRLVYAMSEADLLPYSDGDRSETAMMTGVGCRAVLQSGQRTIEVLGPFLAEEAITVHEGFWENLA